MKELEVIKNKKKFLQAEYEKHFKYLFNSYSDFVNSMEMDAIDCKNCGCYYWNGCRLRCNCI